LIDLSALEIRDRIARGSISTEEVTRAFLEQIERIEPKIHAFISRMADEALTRARELDRLRSRGDMSGTLHGVPLAVKDIISVQDVPCTCGSRILKNYVPPYNATAVNRLVAEGAVILGKTNMDEFAMGSSTENSAFKTTVNPWDLDRVPGGSSGGSAAAVAARLVPMALGTDTGGSIRQPAALCGVVGLKPTYGRISRYGLAAFASSLDQIGPLSRSVADTALLLGALAAHDPLDSTSARAPVADYLGSLDGEVRDLKLGIPAIDRKEVEEQLDPEVLDCYLTAITTLKAMGVETKEIELPDSSNSLACYTLIATAEASSNLARYDGVRYGDRQGGTCALREMIRHSRTVGLGPEVKRRILLGTYILSEGYFDTYYLKAQKVRALLTREIRQIFDKVDAVALPTTPASAFRLGEKLEDPLQMYLSDIYTITANLAGIPAVSIPAGFSRAGLPIGLQIMGRHFDEVTILRLAHAFEQATDYWTRCPPIIARPGSDPTPPR